MRRRPFGRSSLEGSALGLGGLHFGVFLDQSATSDLVHRALDAGINVIDTAPPYGHGRSEEMIGRALIGRRHQALLTTKVGLVAHTAVDGTFCNRQLPLTAETIRCSLESSLLALQTDYLDLFQIHAFDQQTPLQESLDALSRLADQGKIRHYGCSNHDPRELAMVIERASAMGIAPPVSSQVHYNLIERRAEAVMAPLCEEHGLGMIANRSLARGVLTAKYQKVDEVPDTSRAAASPRLKSSLHGPTLRVVGSIADLAAQQGRTAAELALAWLAERPAVTTILVGVRDPAQLAQCIRGVEWRLPTAILSALEEIITDAGLRSRVQDSPPRFFEK